MNWLSYTFTRWQRVCAAAASAGFDRELAARLGVARITAGLALSAGRQRLTP
jgi:hypothetical protein